MDGWSPIVATFSDDERSSSEGEYTIGTGQSKDTEKGQDEQQGLDQGATAGFGMTGFGDKSLRLNRTGQTAEQELRYLHLLWEPGRAGSATGVGSKPGKVTGTRARRHIRVRRNVGPIGKDLYGKFKITDERCVLQLS